jgi:hypothetical protein
VVVVLPVPLTVAVVPVALGVPIELTLLVPITVALGVPETVSLVTPVELSDP